MDLKGILKSLKLNESTISMLLGAIVIVVVGVLVINYFRGQDEGEIFTTLSTQDSTLPTTHTVMAGEDLWSISEIYYESGYNWVDIAEANNLSQPGQIEEGQSLSIPDVESRLAEAVTQIPTLSPTPTSKPTTTNTPTPTVVVKDDEVMTETKVKPDTPISGDTYTVVRGDTLWDIAIRAYGDGHRWSEIASDNDLVNPDLIHAGNVFTLPR